jgi:hypothetical protein
MGRLVNEWCRLVMQLFDGYCEAVKEGDTQKYQAQ